MPDMKRSVFVLIWIVHDLRVRAFVSSEGQVIISEAEQEVRNRLKLRECLLSIQNDPYPETGLHCNRTWDGISCWKDTPAGSLARQQCPDYVNGFFITDTVTRQCMPDGQWYVNPEYNETWSNYTQCMRPPDPTPLPTSLAVHIHRIQLLYNTGYGISLVSLLLAVFILLHFKKLRCPRNTVHVNLFVSFILRAVVNFLKALLVVDGLGFAFDVERTPVDTVLFIDQGSHWECKLLYTLFHYILSANYMWVLVEGLYLYTLVNVSVFSERSSVRWYYPLGWGTPLLSVIPWVIVRARLEDTFCWNTNQTLGYFWILQTPIVISLALNFVFFIRILWSLFTKLHTPTTVSARYNRYKRLAKSTLILIPLFGVHFIVFVGMPIDVDPEAEIVKLYFESFFYSFQGFVVAVLFCFLNREVQMEIRKKWRRLWSKPDPRYLQQTQYLAVSANGNCRRQRNDCRPSSITANQADNPASSESSSDHYGCLCKWTLDTNGKLKRTFVRTGSQRPQTLASFNESKL